tara:strand:+ start:9290 stop:9892 length:603 start_codon:yes stop_codon:yes gene_type:complete
MVQRSTTLNPDNDASELAQYVVFVREIVENHFRFWKLSVWILLGSLGTGIVCFMVVMLFPLGKPRLQVLYALIPVLVGLIISIRTNTPNYQFGIEPRVRTGDELHLELYSRTAKVDRDMAYGMWAILQRQGATGLPRPDYSSSTAEIYRIFTLNLITNKIANTVVSRCYQQCHRSIVGAALEHSRISWVGCSRRSDTKDG